MLEEPTLSPTKYSAATVYLMLLEYCCAVTPEIRSSEGVCLITDTVPARTGLQMAITAVANSAF